jgi:hypothetical protein
MKTSEVQHTDSMHELESLFREIRNSKEPQKSNEVKDLTNFYRYHPAMKNQIPIHPYQTDKDEDARKMQVDICLAAHKKFFNESAFDIDKLKNPQKEFDSQKTIVQKIVTMPNEESSPQKQKKTIQTVIRKWIRTLCRE